MFCPDCGTRVPDGARFCQACGASIPAVEASQPVQLAAFEQTPQPAAASSPFKADDANVRAPQPDASFPYGATSQPTAWQQPADPQPTTPQPATAAATGAPRVLMFAAAGLFTLAAASSLVSLFMGGGYIFGLLNAVVCAAAAVLCALRRPFSPRGILVTCAAYLVVTLVEALITFFRYRARGLDVSFFGYFMNIFTWVVILVGLAIAVFDLSGSRMVGPIVSGVAASALVVRAIIGLGNVLGLGAYFVVIQLFFMLCPLAYATAAFAVAQEHEATSPRTKATPAVGAQPAAYDHSALSGDSLPRYPHPYHQLGGWLKALVVMGYVGMALMALMGIVMPVMLWSIGASTGMYEYGSGSIIIVAQALVALAFFAGAAFLWVFLGKIRRKDPTFLRDYHYLGIVTVVMGLLAVLANGAQSLRSVVSTLVTMGLYTLYFVKSVRVRTYMGSDAYLRLSPITRNVPSPMPADTVPYQGA